MTVNDIDALRAWIGRKETRTDVITAAPLAALAATLDRVDPAPVDSVAPLHHWLFFLPVVPLAQVGADGHPARGGFLPPVPLPRRMWASSRMVFARPLRPGESVTRTSEIVDVAFKDGKSGPLVFVKVLHELSVAAGLAITEAQDIVYRDDPKPGVVVTAAATEGPGEAAWKREIRPDPVLLFRYSALTFNGHRIHYDRPYATAVEGYPGLVVHGPLLATLLADLVRRNLPDATLASFQFRALRPVFDGAAFQLCGAPSPDGRSVRLWVRDAAGALCFEAGATLA